MECFMREIMEIMKKCMKPILRRGKKNYLIRVLFFCMRKFWRRHLNMVLLN